MAMSWCWRRSPDGRPITPGFRLASECAAPPSELVVLIRRGNLILGQIDIDSDVADPFTPEEEAAVKEVADALAILL
jgi:putative methionine-R-sulfoxide reductase with GAF domain